MQFWYVGYDSQAVSQSEISVAVWLFHLVLRPAACLPSCHFVAILIHYCNFPLLRCPIEIYFRFRLAQDIFEPKIGKRQRKPLIRRFKLNLTRCVTFDIIHNNGAILCEFLFPFLLKSPKSKIWKLDRKCLSTNNFFLTSVTFSFWQKVFWLKISKSRHFGRIHILIPL